MALNQPLELVHWSQDEQAHLERGLTQFAAEPDLVKRYLLIKRYLPNKNVKDIVLRVKEMKEIGNSKKRKANHNLTIKDKGKEKVSYDLAGNASQQKIENSKKGKANHNLTKSKGKEKVSDDLAGNASQFASRPGVSASTSPMVMVDIDDDISYQAIGGHTDALLEHNAQLLDQISVNLAASHLQGNIMLQDNFNLFWEARQNIIDVLTNGMNENMPENMKEMPKLKNIFDPNNYDYHYMQ